jgi:hypothetical protein
VKSSGKLGRGFLPTGIDGRLRLKLSQRVICFYSISDTRVLPVTGRSSVYTLTSLSFKSSEKGRIFRKQD